MKNIFTLVCLIFCAASSYLHAQEKPTGSISGKLTDTTNKQVLRAAYIDILNSKDSSLVLRQLSQADGSFSMGNIPFSSYILRISYLGYDTVTRKFTVDAAHLTTELGTVYMQLLSHNLAGVTVQNAPMQVKKDTVEFNASMYATKPNSAAEDVLKKLPGVQVDKSGNITAQGEKVTRILVDGKRFFSDDPKLATKNLPTDIIDKIQVFDDQSDQSKFTGFDDGNRVKTINITTKKNARQGYFGKAVAAVGTSENYDESINMHRFKGSQQISLLGQANDINKQNKLAPKK